jgi:hypothetical protein
VIWSAVPWLLAAAVWAAESRARRRTAAASDLEAIWLWFRDHWGVVWALRVQERFNRTAHSAQWPVRLTWFGIARHSPDDPIPDAALATLRSLLHRFATPQRIDEVQR